MQSRNPLRRLAGLLALGTAVAVPALGGPAAPLAAAPEGATAPAGGDAPVAAQGELVVRYEPGASRAQRRGAREDAGVVPLRGLDLAGAQLVELRDGSTAAALAELRSDPAVAAASRNWLRRPTALPDDPLFGELWGLHNTGQAVRETAGVADADIDAPEAWDIQPGWGPEGENGVVVAVMDTGADLGHPDLAGRLWTNPGEIPGNEEDDDANGYVDDVHGYDFAGASLEDTGDADADPDDPVGHGTHVAGTVLAEGDNSEGVVGVAPGSKLMVLKVCALDGEGKAACPLDAILDAYAYAVGNGAAVLNGSLGGPGLSPPEVEALSESPQTLFVFAAGNGGKDGKGDDVDTEHQYPCALDEQAGYTGDNLLCVAATTQEDGLASFSNFGGDSVDLGAPGVNVLSTYPRALTPDGYLPYAYLNGTSMATPHVTGAAALLLSALPATSAAEAKQAILEATDPLAALAGKTVSGGRLNARAALEELGLEAPGGGEGEEGEEEGAGEEPGPQEEGGPPAIPADSTQAADSLEPAEAQAGPRSSGAAAPRTFFRRRPAKLLLTPWRWGRAVFRFRSNEGGVAFLCQFDDKRYRKCPARFVRWFGLGRHVLRVKARDAAGNVDGTPAVYRFRVRRSPRAR
jgi:subtilisin family serine protease